MTDKFIAIKTGNPDYHQIYKHHEGTVYHRYDDEGIIIYKNKESCQNKVDKLIRELQK